MKKNWDNYKAARRELLKNSSGVVFRSHNGRQRTALKELRAIFDVEDSLVCEVQKHDIGRHR